MSHVPVCSCPYQLENLCSCMVLANRPKYLCSSSFTVSLLSLVVGRGCCFGIIFLFRTLSAHLLGNIGWLIRSFWIFREVYYISQCISIKNLCWVRSYHRGPRPCSWWLRSCSVECDSRSAVVLDKFHMPILQIEIIYSSKETFSSRKPEMSFQETSPIYSSTRVDYVFCVGLAQLYWTAPGK